MSDSEDDMPMIARRRVISTDAADAKPAEPTMKREDTTAKANASALAPQHKPETAVKQEDKPAADATATSRPAPVKHQQADDSSDDEDDVPIAARAKPAGAKPPGAAAAAAVKAEPIDGNSTHEQQHKPDSSAAKKPAAAAAGTAAAKHRSSDGGSKKAGAGGEKQSKVKQESDSKPAAKRPAVKRPAAKPAANGAAKSDSAAVKKDPKEPAIRKKFELPGQTRETPDESDPLRKFYTSLLQEKPESAMAKKWCVQCGLLPEDEAAEWVAQNKGGRAAASTPVKAAKRPAAPARRGPAKKKVALSDDEDEKPKPKPKPKAKPVPKGVPRKEKVDFGDSSDDDSSDDDVPLAKRNLKAKA